MTADNHGGYATMTAAFIEHRPKSTDKNAGTTHHVIVVNGEETGAKYKTQKEAHDKACADGYRPVHVARERHLQDRDNPDHFRKDPC
jgi:hypothetical protein